jgi:hypothetical protein
MVVIATIYIVSLVEKSQQLAFDFARRQIHHLKEDIW